MTKVIELDKIKQVIPEIDIISIIEAGFIAYSEGKVTVPPIGEMIFKNPPGDVHIKYGFINEDDVYVIKIASGFYDNPKLGLPSSDGVMLVFNQKTGELNCVLNDRGYLTNVRTAAAGAVAAKYLAPKAVKRIGIIGAGLQGRMQLDFLSNVVDCREAIVWGLNREEVDSYKEEMEKSGFSISTTLDANEAAQGSNLIITCTPSTKPLISADAIGPGTHITTMGSDTPEKQEVDAAVVEKADVVVADSKPQCELRGEIFKAIEAGVLNMDTVAELGNVAAGKTTGRTSEEQITLCDLTGVAVQDIQIAKAVSAGAQ